MNIIVQKFGGTSVENTAKIKKIAKRLAVRSKRGDGTVVVVSAMGKTTDELVNLSKEISLNPSKRELDVLLSTGEQVTIALLAMAVQAESVDSISLTGFQAGISTSGEYTRNKIDSIEISRINRLIKEGKIVIVAGFQGINNSGDITTLGRGGSDTTAVALAARLDCPCEIYTDVDGIYTVDPRIIPAAKKLQEISYDEMMEMSSLGATVLETRAVEIACKYNVPLYLANSNMLTSGTKIIKGSDLMESKAITGLSVTQNVLMVTINNVECTYSNISMIFNVLANKEINIDMISQTSPHNGITNISFTVDKNELNAIQSASEELKVKLADIDIELKNDISKISVIGIGMMNQSGVAAKVFQVFANNHLEFNQVTTSEISISFTVDSSICEYAVNKLAIALDLSN